MKCSSLCTISCVPVPHTHIHLPAFLLPSLPCAPPFAQEVRQLCDISMVLVRQIADRLTKGKPQQPGSFPGSVMLPRIFRPDTQKGAWRGRQGGRRAGGAAACGQRSTT